MERYPRIVKTLRTIFNAEDGLSLDVSKRLYVRYVTDSPALAGFKAELSEALADPTVSWKRMLHNEEYEIHDAATEQEAKAFVSEILWAPLEGDQ